jgi:hypothetical protein
MSFSAACKATNHSAGFIAGDESPAYRPHEFFRNL